MGRKGRERDQARDAKIEAGRAALREAATGATVAADDLVTYLRRKLDDSLAQIETTARILKDAMVLCDLDGRLRSLNPAAERMFGVNEADMIGRDITSMFRTAHMLDGSATLAVLGDANLWADPDNPPVWGRHSDGSSFMIECSTARLDRADGSSALILIRDLSETYRLIENARASEGRFKGVFETAFDAILIVQNGKVVATNPALSRLFGYRPEEVLGRTAASLFVPDDRAQIEREMSGDDVDGVHRDGRFLDLCFTSSSIRWNDQPAKLVTVRELTSAPRPILNDEMICCFGPDFIISFVNEAFARHCGRSRADTVGMDVRELLDEDERDPMLINLRALKPASPIRRMTVEAERDGTHCIRDWVDRATFDADGNVVEYQRVGRDLGTVI